jgi:putative membrane protein
MSDSTGGPDVTTSMMKDKMFLRKAAEGGLAEVQLGKLAAQKGGSDEVKSFGQKMVEDHTAINKQMATVADEMGVRLPQSPGKEDQAEFDKLNSLSGDGFDTEYLTYMVKDHHKDLREFRMEATSTPDAELRDAVNKASMVIRDHMMMVDKMAKDKGIAVPGRRGGGPPPPPQQ